MIEETILIDNLGDRIKTFKKDNYQLNLIYPCEFTHFNYEVFDCVKNEAKEYSSYCQAVEHIEHILNNEVHEK